MNGLEVAVAPQLDPEITRELEAILDDLEIPYSIVQEGVSGVACTSRANCDSPQRAGVAINGDGSLCSTGWVVNRSGVRRMLTAGHCWHGTTSGAVTTVGGDAVANLTATTALTNGSHADLRILSVNDSRPWNYRNDSEKSRVVTGVSNGYVDGPACLFGRNNASPRCGVIVTTNTSCKPIGSVNITVYGLMQADYSSSGGDSGGAVATSGIGSVARGVHACTNARFTSLAYLSTYGLGTVATG